MRKIYGSYWRCSSLLTGQRRNELSKRLEGRIEATPALVVRALASHLDGDGIGVALAGQRAACKVGAARLDAVVDQRWIFTLLGIAFAPRLNRYEVIRRHGRVLRRILVAL